MSGCRRCAHGVCFCRDLYELLEAPAPAADDLDDGDVYVAGVSA